MLVYDLGNGEIVGAKVFKFNKNKTKKQQKDEISSLYVAKFFKSLFHKYKIIDLQPNLIIHTDRGTEFLSKEYTSLKHTFSIQLSMSEAYQPTQNAVAERLNKTIKLLKIS